MAYTRPKHIVAFVDIPDPDNFVMLIALVVLFQNLHDCDLHVVITGRPVHPDPDKDCQNWDWDDAFSQDVLKVNVGRTRHLLRQFGARLKFYDGGIAPRSPVPHWLHFHEYYRMQDVDPVIALHQSRMASRSDLIKFLLGCDDGSVAVVIGGPMTGLAELVLRNPAVVSKFSEVHAMFATWGNVELMNFGDQPRGARQFNAVCDPPAAYQVLMGLPCPIYLMPTEVTRVNEIGFWDVETLREILPDTRRAQSILRLYELWYRAAVVPRRRQRPDERIFIHDFVSALSLDPELRERIYDVRPIEITSVPHLPFEGVTDEERARFAAEEQPVPADLHWGEVQMRLTDQPTNRFAAVSLKPGGAEIYMETLARIFA